MHLPQTNQIQKQPDLTAIVIVYNGAPIITIRLMNTFCYMGSNTEKDEQMKAKKREDC